jgi:hypothetical protein
MCEDMERLRLRPGPEGIGELTVLSAFCIFGRGMEGRDG